MDRSLEDDEWNAVFSLAKLHTVQGVLIDGVKRLAPGSLPRKTLLYRWIAETDRIERQNLWMNQQTVNQKIYFEQQHLNPILLKGQTVSALYNNPLRRSCGDVDWYFRTKSSFHKAVSQLKSDGLKVFRQTNQSYFVDWGGCPVELHTRLIDLHNPFIQNYLRSLETEHLSANPTFLLNGELFNELSPILVFVKINAHILKHILSFGIGLRHVCDSARVSSHYCKLVDGDELKVVYKKLGMYKWINLLHELQVRYLGLSPDRLPFRLDPDPSARRMMKQILSDGNFGFASDIAFGSSSFHSGRPRSFSRWRRNFAHYFRYAPMEAISFPVVHLLSRYG